MGIPAGDPPLGIQRGALPIGIRSRHRLRLAGLAGLAGLALALLFLPSVRAEENEEPEAAPPKPRVFQIEKAKNPYKLPEGPSRAAWELYLKNDFAVAAKAFAEVAKLAPQDLENLEGWRASLIAQGLYTEAQAINLRMITAAAGSPLCHVFASRAMETLGVVESRARLAACLTQAAAQAAPAVRATLLDLSVTLHLSADRTEEARRAVQGLGYVNKWLFLAGPFGAADRNNPLERRFAPERPLKSLAFRDERGKPVTVRQDVPVPYRTVNLTQIFPGAQGIMYAFTNLESDRDQEVLLIAGAPGEARFFLRGLPILQELVERQYPREPRLVKVRLLKGPNPLLVKLPQPAELAVRVLQPDYAPASGVSVQPLAPEVRAAHEVIPVRGFLFSAEANGALAEDFLKRFTPDERALGKGLKTIALDGSLTVAQAPWVEWAAKQENDQPAREAVARTLAGSFPDAVGPLDQAATILAAVGRAEGLAESRHLEESRQLRERALTLVPASHQHLLGLYSFFQEHELHDQAFEKLKACADAHPKSALAQARLGAAYLEKGLLAEAQQKLEQAAVQDAAFLPDLARYHRERGNHARARELEARLAELGLLPRQEQFDRALDRGALDEAGQLLTAQEQAFPDRLDQFLELGVELALEKGDPAAALDLRKKLVDRQPKNRPALVSLVDLALHLKRDAQAQAALKQYLADHPSDFELRRRWRDLEGQGGERWWEPYDIQVKSVDTSQFTQERYPRANHAWIVDFMVVKVFPDLSRESYVHIAQKVLNLDGINELSEVLVRARARDLVFIRTLNPDGSSYQPENVHHFNLAQSASFLKVGPGSILEHAYLEHEDADEFEPTLNMAFNFMALDSPRAVSRWVVMIPKELKLDIRKICPELIDEKVLPGPEGYVVYQWTNKKVEGIKVERLMPTEADQEVIPLVFVESPERPFRATTWLTQREQLFVPEAAAAKARELTAALPSAPARFRAIVDWVRTNILPGKEARTLEDVWTLRSGHTGQMSSLALAMCRAVGLPVRAALVNRSYNPGRAWRGKNAKHMWEPVAFANFGSGGRLLVLEPEDGPDVWLQFAGQPARFYSPTVLLEPQPGALALCPGEDGVRIKPVAAELLGREPFTHRVSLALDERGAGAVRGVMQFFGGIAGQLRQALGDPRRATQIRQQLVRQLWPQMEPAEIRTGDEDRVDRPLRLTYGGTIRNLAAVAGKSLYLAPFPTPSALLQLMGPAERIHDLVIKPDTAEQLTDLDVTFTYEAPPGYGWVETPDDAFLCTEFGFYVVDFSVKGRVLTCSRSYLVPSQRVTPEKFPKLMEFLQKVAEVERQRVAYARLDYPGGTDLIRAVRSVGYASHGGDPEEKEGEGKDGGEPKAAP